MIKWIETTGRSEEDAISAALFQLGLDRDDVSIEVIERAKLGFLGFGSNPAKVRVSYEVAEEGGAPIPAKDQLREDILSVAKNESKPIQNSASKTDVVSNSVSSEGTAIQEEPHQKELKASGQEETILSAKPWQLSDVRKQGRPERREQQRKPRPTEDQLQEGDEVLIGGTKDSTHKEVTMTLSDENDEKAKAIRQFLIGLMEHLKVQTTPEVYITSEGGYKIILQGSNLGAIIGRRGETLDAIQQLTNYSVNNGQSKRVRIHIDAEGYRAKREESLQRLAVKVAGKVVKYRKSMTLEAMNAYERHVIHTALQEYPNVTTYSTGVEPNRRTVVAYAPGQK